ncbi:metal ABC transporter permease [Listeria ilorinensis]|uniref:metal ABC transporter permease n=1 Tax=Listeria ilorinensis TaxID=2867439 RepID=UPI001EF3E1CD|nr:metal ABC transporter permease [Listeria ilorinensis]
MEMFLFGFMQRAFLSTLLIAVLAPLLGTFLILRRQSLLADTLSHISLAGVALGFVIGINPTWTTFLIIIGAAFLIEYLRSIYATYSEVSIAILMAGGLAVALVLMSINQGGMTTSVNQYLFGSIVTITRTQVEIIFLLTLVVVCCFFFFRRQMYVLTFSEEIAQADGLQVRLLSTSFSVLTGLSIAVIMPIAGALLVSAVMILPAAIGIKISRTFVSAILVSILIGLIGMVLGLVTSYHLGTPPGATITLFFISMFILVQGVLAMLKRT